MRNAVSAVMAVIGIGAVAIWSTVPSSAQVEAKLNLHKGKKVPGHYIVVLKDGADASAVAQRHGANPTFVYSTAINGFAAQLNRGQLQQVLRDADVTWVDEDGEVQAVQLAPGDGGEAFSPASGDVDAETAQPGATWGIDKLDQHWGGGTDGNYNYTNKGLGVNVYILDTGIRPTHNEFDGAALNRAKVGASGFDAIGDGQNGRDCNGHGTHVAGTVGGTKYGVAKAVKLYAVRVLNCAGSGSFAQVIAGVDWVTNNHIKPAVANMSLAGGFNAALNAAVAKSVSWGVTYVLAAANENSDACNFSPASEPSAITVGATDIANARAGFSNWGPCVDINGPGVNITSAWWTSDVATNTISGTSMSSPHVAGLAALYLETAKTAAPGQVTDALLNTGVRNVISGLFGGTPNLLAHKVNGLFPIPVCANLGGSQEPDVFNGQCYYYAPNAAWAHVWLRGTPGTNFNVEFYQWDGANWIKKAQKITTSTNEYLKYFAPGGTFYMFLIKNAAGLGTYDATIIHQGMQAGP